MEERFTYILIGALGHLGKTIISQLSGTGVAIRAFDFALPKLPSSDPRLTYYQGDVTKPETLEPVFQGLEPHRFCVIHLAAIIDIQARRATPKLISVNVEGVKNAFACFERYQGKRFIYVSSVDAFLQTHSEIDETAPLAPSDGAGYPATKADATRFIKEKQQAGADAIVVYPSGIIGPGDDGHNHLVQLLRDYVQGKLPGVIPSGYDVVDVRDVASAIITLSWGDSKGDSFLLSGQQIGLKELLLLAKAWNGGKGRSIVVFPFFLAYVGLPFVHLHCKIHRKRPLYTAFAISVVKHANSFKRDKATQAFGYSPRPIKESVDATLSYLREQGLI
jgi:dihydroflavonol-4-reductase